MKEYDSLVTKFKDKGYVVSCGVYLYSGGKILIGHPTGSPWNIWTTPKGQVDNNDSLISTYIRELEEETSIDLSKYKIVREDFLGYNRYKRSKKYLFSYFVEIVEDLTSMDLYCPSMTQHFRTGKTVPEIDEFKWIDPIFISHHLNFNQYKDANTSLNRLVSINI